MSMGHAGNFAPTRKITATILDESNMKSADTKSSRYSSEPRYFGTQQHNYTRTLDHQHR